MNPLINKKTLEKLAFLSRIKIEEKKGKKILQDLEKILEYFGELKELETENVAPMSGGNFLKNITRKDGEGKLDSNSEFLREQFREERKGFLKIPPVFN